VRYPLSGYWIEKGKLEKNKFEKVQLVGKLKEKNWHFGISAAGKLYPFPVLMVSSRILFTQAAPVRVFWNRNLHPFSYSGAFHFPEKGVLFSFYR